MLRKVRSTAALLARATGEVRLDRGVDVGPSAEARVQSTTRWARTKLVSMPLTETNHGHNVHNLGGSLSYN